MSNTNSFNLATDSDPPGGILCIHYLVKCYKLLSTTMILTALLLGVAEHQSATFAGTCASQCGQQPIQFTPGKRIRLEVVNRTPNLVHLQQPSATHPIVLQPRQELRLERGDSTVENISLLFWNETGLSLQAIVSKPNFATLRVELYPTWRIPGDRSVYLQDDGRVNIF
jgi:hypothetical protein